MSRRDKGGAVLFDKDFVDVIGILFHATQKFFTSGRFGIRYRRFKQMTGTVQFVAIAVGKALIRFAHSEIDVEIAVRTLMGSDIVDELLNLCLQGLVRMLGKDIRRTLHPFCHIAVPEIMHVLVCKLERRNAPRIVKTVINGIYRDFSIQFFFRRKVAVRKIYLSVIE